MKNDTFFQIGDSVTYFDENIEVKGRIERKLTNAAIIRIDCCETYIGYYNRSFSLSKFCTKTFYVSRKKECEKNLYFSYNELYQLRKGIFSNFKMHYGRSIRTDYN